jgi:hypothetical protein
MDERKGFLTPQQEQKLDSLIKIKNMLGEKLDGPAIQVADNQGLERLKDNLEKLYPGAVEIVYQVVDTIFEMIPEVDE